MNNNYWENLNNPSQTPTPNPYLAERHVDSGAAYSAGAYSQQHAYEGYQRQAPAPKKKPKRNAGAIALLIFSCFLISLAGGYFGTLLGADLVANVPSSSGERGVFYQPVERVIDSAGISSALSIPEVVGLIKDSVVEIVTEDRARGQFFQQPVETGAGSGVIISEDGYIVTCAHVIEGANNIKITLADSTQYDATVIGTPDDFNDIALLKINATGLVAAVIGDSDKLLVGEDAIVIGNPLGSLGGTVTNGIISALEREVTVEGKAMTLLQTNAAVNPGNSGGGVFNGKGELVGIVNAKSFGQDIEGIGFAIPVNIAKNTIEQLIENGYVSTPAIGISARWINSQSAASEYGVERFGVYVDAVTPGKGAEIAGLREHDYILSIEGEAIDSISDITALLRKYNVGDSVEIQILREGQTLSFTVVLSERNA